jgi:NAD(P)H-dependent FMN reductase
MTKFLTFSGSNRSDSNNQKTVNCIAAALRENGKEVTDAVLSPQPIYNGDDESTSGLPEETTRFKALLKDHDAFIIGCPEYNGFMTPLLLNAINWASRSNDAAPDLSCFTNKTVIVVSASPGATGGMRAATHLKTMLSGIGCIIFPGVFMVPGSFGAFSESGQIVDEGLQKRANQVANGFSLFADRNCE